MSIFEDIKLEWEGKEYVIKSDKVMGAIATLEEIVTLDELHRMLGDRKLKLSKIASAYGAILRYAGAKIEIEEVYAGLFKNKDGTSTSSNGEMITASITGLMGMLIPPTVVKQAQNGIELKNSQGQTASATSLSKNITKRQLAKGELKGKRSGASIQ